MDHLISARQPDQIIFNNKKENLQKLAKLSFAFPADHREKLKENEKKDKHLDLATELKKTVEHESDVYTNFN